MQIWRNAFAAADIDPDFYAYRQRELDEVLPWDHIDIGVKKNISSAISNGVCKAERERTAVGAVICAVF